MDEVQLQTILLKIPVTRQYVGGVSSYDHLQYINVDDNPVYFIVNTGDSNGSGKHWTFMFFDEYSEFFDSLGKRPETYNDTFENMLIVHRPKYLYTCKRLQSNDSNVCGMYCIYFTYQKCLGKSFDEIIRSFTNNCKDNDLKVYLFVQDLCKTYFI